MNERIQALIEQATISRVITGPEVFTTPPIYFDKVKFAELIVRECAGIDFRHKVGMTTDQDFETSRTILEHFGVEPNIVYKMECFNCSVCGLQNPTTSCGLPNCGFFAY